jgi:predicted dehydrogenase
MPYRIGVVGGGLYGSRILRAFYSCHKAGTIVLSAIADINPEVIKDAADTYGISGYLDYKEMVEKENLDAVAIVTPDFLHEEIAVYCAERKLHIMVQKPLDTTVEGAQRIVEAAEKNGVLLFVDFHKRFDPSLILLRNKIRNGLLGEILYGYSHIEDIIVYPSFHFKKWAHKSSPVWFIGIHMIDVFNWALGVAPVKVSAIGAKKKLKQMGVDTYDFIQSKLIYANGSVITLDAGWVLPNSFLSGVNQGVRMVGTEGIMEIDGQHRGVESYSTATGGMIENPYGYLENENAYTGCSLSGYTIDTMLHFPQILTKLEKGEALSSFAGTYASGREALLATKIAVAIHQSAESGGTEITV